MSKKIPGIQLTEPPLPPPNEKEPLKHLPEEAQNLIKHHTKLIEHLKGEAVLLLDGQWGSGKTTLVKAWMQYIQRNEQQNEQWTTIYIDAFQHDFNDDALIMISQEIIAGLRESKGFKEKGVRVIKGLAEMAPHALRSMPGTAGIGSLIDIYLDKQNTMANRIKEVQDALEDMVEENKVIIFIDELDRCRPAYAIETLEKIKHIFAVNNVIFVLVASTNQLSKNLEHLYGKVVHTDEYLQKLVGYRISMPIHHSSVGVQNFEVELEALLAHGQHAGQIRQFWQHMNGDPDSFNFITQLTYRQNQKIYLEFFLFLCHNKLHFPTIYIENILILLYLRTLHRESYENIKNESYTEGSLTKTGLISNRLFYSKDRNMSRNLAMNILGSYIFSFVKILSEEEFKNLCDEYKEKITEGDIQNIEGMAESMVSGQMSISEYCKAIDEIAL